MTLRDLRGAPLAALLLGATALGISFYLAIVGVFELSIAIGSLLLFWLIACLVWLGDDA